MRLALYTPYVPGKVACTGFSLSAFPACLNVVIVGGILTSALPCQVVSPSSPVLC